MKIILDTCTFLWICSGDDKLSQTAKDLFQSSDNEIYLSVISEWEICVKYALKKLPLPEIPEHFIPSRRKSHHIEILPLEEISVLQISKLPLFHNDPFDRMLIAQAITEGASILTPDTRISQYPVWVQW